jgi:hypothetical protein
MSYETIDRIINRVLEENAPLTFKNMLAVHRQIATEAIELGYASGYEDGFNDGPIITNSAEDV